VTRLFALGLILLTVLGSVWGLSASSKAQTPDAQSGTPVAATCEGDPRPMDFLVTIVAAPKPEISPTAIAAIPTGEPVDDETRTAVVRVVETLTACVNAGDYLRAFALFDDEYLRRRWLHHHQPPMRRPRSQSPSRQFSNLPTAP
jgi:hypothetical protein